MTIASAIAGARTTLQRIEGKTVTFTDGTNEVDVTAVPVQVEVELVDAEGLPTLVTMRDYTMVLAADLVLDGSTVKPTHGHQIQETIGGSIVTHDVSPVPGEGCTRWQDPGHTVLRIHTREVN